MRPESDAPQSRSTAQPQRRVPSASATHAVPSRLIAQSAEVAPGTHATQRFESGSHTGVAPVHAVMLAVVHCTQRPASRPIVAQAGVGAEQSLGDDERHGRHMRRAVSQMGIAPAQSALLVQPTQVLVARSQTPERQSRLLAHCTQRPALAPLVAHAVTPGSVQSAAAVPGAQPRPCGSSNRTRAAPGRRSRAR